VPNIVGFAQDLRRDQWPDSRNGHQVLVRSQLEGGGNVGLDGFDLGGDGVQAPDRGQGQLRPYRVMAATLQCEAAGAGQGGLADQGTGHLSMACDQAQQ
jgi:hypothetical protein